MSVLDTKTELHLERLCYDTKDDGVIPYWKCLSGELSKIDNKTQPDLSVVDTSTELHIGRLCYDIKDDGVLPYWSCLRKELNKIGITPPEIPIKTKQSVKATSTIIQETQPVVEEPVIEKPVFKSKPDLSGLHELTKFITEQYCESYKKWGIQDYWGCLYQQIEESKKVSLPDLGSVHGETREIIPESCEISLRWGVESFYSCLNKQINSIK